MITLMDIAQWIVLIIGATAAGWVDAVIGGGGLVLIPLILSVAPGFSYATAAATNKMAAVSGTASATWALARKVPLDKRFACQLVPLALLCSAGGALVAAQINKDIMRPVVIVLLLFSGTFVALRPQFGQQRQDNQEKHSTLRRVAILGVVALIAMYDGVFGPGTGMFLIMSFSAIIAKDFMQSAVLAKIVNTSTNLGALAVFIAGGYVMWKLGVVLALANIAGAQLGARTVLGGGTKLLRRALLVLVVVMSAYLAWQQYVAMR
ncbi:TSUP family transporter [Corynebacterium sp. SY003]|uniref:TSUP family transporter n=2 Tax=unclassified Corynebacterium TaxID=2624378 RepID=UPI00351B7587